MNRPVFDPGQWFSRADEHERFLREAVAQDPEIREASRLSVSVEREGAFGGKKVVRLLGKTHSAHDRQRAQEIVADNTDRDAEIVNEIIVEPAP